MDGGAVGILDGDVMVGSVSITVPRSVRTRTVGMTLWVLSIVVVKNAEPKVAMTLPMATPVRVLPNPR